MKRFSIFIAIRFNDEFKRKLVEIQDSLKSRGVTGNYCSYDNLHMTLAFIGEHYDLPATPWIRFSAEAVFEERRDIRDAIIEKSSIVNALYSKMREIPIFKVFYLKNIDGWMTNLGNVKCLEKRAEFAKPIHFAF